ncbi:MAG TPA: transglutaminase family protein [Bryobacteraceae bacterium]|nr:transglutaminase family protein [Bryobacteraceae bacterium]
MLIRLGYDIQFSIPAPVAMVALLHVYPGRAADLQEPDILSIDPAVPVEQYLDGFGNLCSRFLAPTGPLRLSAETVIKDSGLPDPVYPEARQVPIDKLPAETLQYLLNSRYCEVDRLSNIATDLFADTAPGWSRVQEICDWVHSKVTFGYHFARSNKTALDVYTERQGVCRDFQHLAITLCRCMNIPARYATGYLGDIGVPPSLSPMDFSAWFEVYLEDRWWTFDARHNQPRIGRALMAVGRDASDVALTTSFGSSQLTQFTVTTEEIITPPSLIDLEGQSQTIVA